MIALHPEYVVDEQQHPKAVLLPFDEWQHLLELLEDMEDIRLYDETKSSGSELIPFEQAIREIRNGVIA